MISWQSRVLYLLIKHVLSKNLSATHLKQERDYLDHLGRKSKMAAGVKVEKLNINGLYAESLSCDSARAGQIILYLHGGSYCLGSCDSHRAMVSLLAKETKRRVILLEYRLAPEYPFPAALDDAVNGYEWLLQNSETPGKLILMGDSSGAGLAVAAATVLRERRRPLPQAIVCWSPLTDLSLSGPSVKNKAHTDPMLKEAAERAFIARYAAKHDLRDPLMSPVFGDLTGLPPMLIQAGEHEILFDDAACLADRARRDGVDVTLQLWEGMWHVWPYFWPIIPEGRRAVEETARFLQIKSP